MSSSRRSIFRFLRRFLSLPASRSITAHTLAKLFLTSLRLYPVAIAAQFIGMASMTAAFWTSGVSRIALVVWGVFGLVELWFSLVFVRSFWRDTRRAERIRLWIRRWTILASCAGIIWGTAGVMLVIPHPGLLQVLVVAIIVAVTFASWPVYSCWMPSLAAFSLLSLAPVTITVAVQYGVSQTMMALIGIILLGFVLYSGRRLNEILLSTILSDDQNQRLVQRLKVEVTRTENARRATELESARRAQFFAAANHDIRQPLQAMGIFLDILKRRATPQTAPVIEQISQTSKTISTLVEQVLEVSRMEFGRLELHPEVITIPELFSGLARDFVPLARKKGLELRIQPIPAAVMTDRLMIRRALQNLISNAIHYTDRPGAEIVLAARRVGNHKVTLGVYDAGPGLTAEERGKIFDTFYRGKAGKRQPGEGFGLGLSIVKGICRQLGIQLTVGSRPGRGSVFRLVLDLVETEQVQVLESKPEGDAPVDRFEGAIALLEDNPFVGEALSATLTSWGATVVKAEAWSEEFLERAREARAEKGRLVLLSDFNLGDGELTGLAAAGRLEAGLGDRVPTVLLTAVATDLIEAEWRRMKEAGESVPAEMPVILQKPASDKALSAAIAGVASRSGPVSMLQGRTEG